MSLVENLINQISTQGLGGISKDEILMLPKGNKIYSFLRKRNIMR
jgi:hypothetical protein